MVKWIDMDKIKEISTSPIIQDTTMMNVITIGCYLQPK